MSQEQRTDVTGRRVRSALATGVAAVTLLLTGCDPIFGPGNSDVVVRYEADVLRVVEREHEWSPYPIAYLEAAVRGTNASADTVSVHFPGCLIGLEVATPGEGAEPAWRLRSGLAWRGGWGSGCIGGHDYTVPPGESFVVSSGEVPLANILADSLPTGPYDVRLRVESRVTRGATERIREPVIELGDVVLPESHFPLELDFFSRDDFVYRVAVETGPAPNRDGLIHLTIERAGNGPSTLTRDLRRDCPVQLFAFRTREERDRIPTPRPVWQWPHQLLGCGPETMPVRLDLGGAFALTSVVPSRRVALGDGEVEDFHYMIVIEADGRPMRFALDPS